MAEEKNKANDLIKILENFFKQAPKLPTSVTEVLVKITPWLALIFGILGLIAGLGALGLSPVAMLGGLDTSAMVIVVGVASIVSSTLMLMAYPKLMKHQYKGWELLFWSEVITAVLAVVSLSVGSVLGALIGFYLLFQIKSYYK